MNLPTISTPKYSLKLPSTGDTITYRPFLVREEKILLVAQQEESEKSMMNAISEVIDNCTFGKLNTNKLPNFDIEYIFLMIRAKSVGEVVDLVFKCPDCGMENDVSVSIVDVKPPKATELPEKIMLTDEIGVVPKYITGGDVAKLSAAGSNDPGKALTMAITASLESIFDADKVYPVSEASEADMDEFISSLTRSQIEKIEAIISDQPAVTLDVPWTCIKCKKESVEHIKGAQNFF